ncbi:FAR1-related sequence 5 [Euphorbia peplus]|nr:FAR1-related sequence 5 [Euphorbia peplus]
MEADDNSAAQIDDLTNNIVNSEQSDGEQDFDNEVVSDQLKPTIGKEFETLDDVFKFYNAYARNVGFSVRLYSSKKKKGTQEIIRKEYVCSKQGKSKKFRQANAQRRRGQYRASCNAKLVVVRNKNHMFTVKTFTEEHNHSLLTPTKTPFLRSHRQVSSVAKSLSEQMSTVNIPTHQQYNFLQVQAGGMENVGCTQKDLYNHKTKERLKLKGHDGDMFHEYFESEVTKNPSFYFKIDADDNKKITRCFWADATMRRSYGFYNDVIIFDTTYNTNRYGMIFAPILGVNNHRQTIVFACALLNGEHCDNFVWLFKQFLKAMPSDAPKMIITDQDPAMTLAISKTLPNTLHRYCIWHIVSKFSEKIGAKKYATLDGKFHDCIWNSESPEEFDLKWTELVTEGGLNKNEWLKHIYQIRSKWIPAYVNHVFSANMSSSQRAETNHAFFKKYINKSNSLFDFMVRFGRGLVKQRHGELVADIKDMNEKPKIKMNHDFLDHMVDLYTNEIYYIFEDEMWVCLKYKIELISETENQQMFTVKRNDGGDSRGRKVLYNKELNFASCSCKKFESFGIPCRHILSYLVKCQDFVKLPDQYIQNRWTKEAKAGVVIDNDGLIINDDKKFILERSQMVKGCVDLIDKAFKSEEAKNILKDGLQIIREKIEGVTTFEEKNSSLCSPATSENELNHLEHVFNEPDKVRAKGCGKRLKGGKEKAMMKAKKNKKSRKCSVCGEVGQAHDKRTCPSLQ